MKKDLQVFLILFIALFSFSVNAQIPNPGFENWTLGNPDGWITNNVPGFGVPVTQSTPHSGTHGLKGEVVSTPGGNFTPIVNSTDINGTGFPVSQQYSTLSFYYQFNQVGTGTLVAYAVFYANGIGVGAGAQIFGSSVSSYTLANIPVTYSGSNPDTCIISFIISDSVTSAPLLGNYFLVDDVSLSGVSGVQEQQNPLAFEISKVQPNPAHDIANIYYSLPQSGDIQFDLYDIGGRNYKSIKIPMETAGKHKIEMDATEIPAGFYFLNMTAENGKSTMKIQIMH